MTDDIAVSITDPLHLLLASRSSGTHLAEVAILAVAAVFLLLLLALVEHVAVGTVVRLARPVRAVGVSAPASYVSSSACAHDAVVAVRTSGVLAVSAPAPTSSLAFAVAAAVVGLLGAVRAIGTFAFAFYVTRTAGAYETAVAEVAVASLSPLAPLERLLSFLASLSPPRHPIFVVCAVVRMLSAVCAVSTFTPTFDVTRTTSANETAVTEVAVTARVPFTLRQSLLSFLATFLSTFLAFAVLTAVVRFLGAVRSVCAFTSTFNVTRAAFAHETTVAEVAVTALVTLTLRT